MAKPEESQLDEHLKDLVYWERFALHLPEIRQPHIDTIKREVRDNIAGQKQALFDQWLRMYPNASWKNVEQALEKVNEKSIAAELRVKLLQVQMPYVAPSQAMVPEEVQVEEVIIDRLDQLHQSFVSLAKDVMTDVENELINGNITVKSLVAHTEQQRAFEIKALQSVKTTDDFFQAILPHYNFLDCYLIVNVATLLSGSIATRASKYDDQRKMFMKETKIKHLHQKLKCYFQSFQSDDKVKVLISLQNAWGRQSVWLVKQLIQQLFCLEHPDQCQWFQVISGSLLVVFLTTKQVAISLIENSKKKLKFMTLIGVIRLKIGNTFILKNEEDKSFSFEKSLIQAIEINNVEVVQLLMQHIQVDINIQTEQPSEVTAPNIEQFEADDLELLKTFFIHFAEKVEITLEHMVLNGRIAVQTLLTYTEAELPPNTESIKTVADFIQAIRPHYSFLNCQLLLTVACQLSDSLERQAAYFTERTTHFKKRIYIAHLLAVPFNHYCQTLQPDISITVTLKLENIWQTCSMWHVETLVQNIFSLKHSDECQWFRVVPGSVIVVFLVAKHKMMRLIVNSVKKREFMRLTGVISLQVEHVYTFIREGNISYSIKEAIVQAKALNFTEVVDFLVQTEQEPLTRDAWQIDDNANYQIYPAPDSTALMIACCNDNKQLVKLLLDNNADPNTRNEQKHTALMYACRNSKIFKMLLDQHADIKLADVLGKTVLHWACVLGNVKIVKLLLNNPDLLDKTQRDGRTPLHLACLHSRLDIVEYLLHAEADLNIQDNEGLTPLHVVCSKGDLQVLKLLLEAKCDTNIQSKSGFTPLHIASVQDKVNVVEQLLDAQVDPNTQDAFGATPLHIACFNGHLQMVKRLLQAKADPNIRSNDGKTPLHNASYNGHLQVVKQLLRAQADPNIWSNDGRTPLHDGSYNGHLQVVKQLLWAQANPNVQDVFGRTPLYIGSLNGHFKIVEQLLLASADPNIRSHVGVTPLHKACAEGYFNIVDLLLKSQADPNPQLKTNGVTPLHIASREGHLKVVERLLRAQADPRIEMIDRITPLNTAVHFGHSEIAVILRKAEVNLMNK